jgi:alpha-tubulin suppressor-like RCC1 family protein
MNRRPHRFSSPARLAVVGLLIIVAGSIASLASASSRERLAPRASISAHLTETFFTPDEAGSVRVIYKPSKKSKGFSYALNKWSMSGSRWQTIRKVTKKGVFKGRRSTAVKTFFGGKPVKAGGYRLKLSFGKASKQLSFVVTASSLPAPNGVPLPFEVTGITNAVMVSAADSYTCALISGGTIECWGSTGSGQLGDGLWSHGHSDSNGDDFTAIPVQVSGINNATEVAAGQDHACAVLSSGAVDCWGNDSLGQLGDGNTRVVSATPVSVLGITDAVQVSAGFGASCAVLSSGAVDCWGANNAGQLGDGTEQNSSTPVPVTGITNAVQVSVGFMSACAVLSGGTVECWGDNTGGELGDGVKDHGHRVVDDFGDFSPTPVPVSGITSAVAVSTGTFHACALLSGGSVECWGGIGLQSQLGDGTSTGSSTTSAVSNITNATSLSVGDYHTCAGLSTGSVECWGVNTSGDLGDGTTSPALTPVLARNVTSATSVAAGSAHTCALLSSGSVECWGSDKDGQLGSSG